MHHQNTIFHAITKQIPWNEFEKIVDRHKADYRVRRLDTKGQFLAMLYAQLSGASSLRQIEAGLQSYQHSLYHLGAKTAARSTLADANANRPWQVFADLFTHMITNANRQTRRRMGSVGDAIRLIDSTKIKLPAFNSSWARFSDKFCAAKVHIVYDPDEALPLSAEITPFNVNDITPAKALKIEPGATYVFDLGYYDFSWWAALNDQGCRLVTRLKTHTKLRNITRRIVPQEADNILSDTTGFLSECIKGRRKNPFTAPVREITVRISTGKIIRITTNDLETPAEEIADLYKQRWQIELFFKWIKQNLKIKHVLGTSENAVRIQVFTALIAYLLLKQAQGTHAKETSACLFTHLVSLNLMQKRHLADLIDPHIPPPPDPGQTTLELIAC